LVDLDYSGHWRINGPAGSGKTVVLLHRAVRLGRILDAPESVLVLTGQDELARELQAIADRIDGLVPGSICFRSFYEWRRSFLQPSKVRTRDLRSGERLSGQDSWSDFLENFRTHNPWVLTGLRKRLSSPALSEYLHTEVEFFRTHFGDRPTATGQEKYARLRRTHEDIELSTADKKAIVRIAAAWRSWKTEGGLEDTISVVYRSQFGPIPRRWSHILVDEAQDVYSIPLHEEMIRKSLAEPRGPNALFLCGDWTQRTRIVKSPKTQDLKFSGRSSPLRLAYRQCASLSCFSSDFAALHEISGSSDRLSLTASANSPSEPARLILLEDVNRALALEFAASLCRKLSEEYFRIGVICWAEASASEFCLNSTVADLKPKRLLENDDFDVRKTVSRRTGIFVCTPELSKGIEFDAVIFLDFTGSDLLSDSASHDRLHFRRAYVAISRARSGLFVIARSPPSRLFQGHFSGETSLGDSSTICVLGRDQVKLGAEALARSVI
jgi:hypothetical protein